MVQRYFWMAYMVLITIAAALGANMGTSYLRAQLTQPTALQLEQDAGTPLQRTQRTAADYVIITKRNIFNATPPDSTPKQPPPAPPPTPPATPTKLQLKLVGTAIGEQQQQNYAFIEDLSTRGLQKSYQVGDWVQGAVIREIQVGRVVLERNGQYEELGSAKKGGVSQNQTPRPRTSSRSTRSSASSHEDILKVDEATWKVSRELMQENFANLGSLSKQARVMPYIVQDETRGFRLTSLKAGSLLQKIGLRHGDVLQKVNGRTLTSPADALQAYQQLQQAGTVRLEILRRNRPTTLTYEIQ